MLDDSSGSNGPAKRVERMGQKRPIGSAPPRESNQRSTSLALVHEEEPVRPGVPSRERVDGRVAFVIGDSNRIALRLARAFAQTGTDIATSIEQEATDRATLKRIADSERIRLHDVVGDMVSEPGITLSVREVINTLGSIDVLLYAAGDAPFNAPYLAEEELGWSRAAEAHILRLSYVCQAVLPHMADRGGGSVVLFTAPARLRPWPDIASSAADLVLLEFMKLLSQRWSPHNVRVNAVSPGWIGSDAGTKTSDREHDPRQQLSGTRPESSLDAAITAARWLASDAASHVRGAHLALDDHHMRGDLLQRGRSFRVRR